MMPTNTIWQEFLAIVKEEVGIQVVETWLKTLSLAHYDTIAQTIVLQAPNTFVKEWVKNQYISLIKTHLARLLSVSSLTIVITDKEQTLPTPETTNNSSTIKPAIVPTKPQLKSTHLGRNSVINSNYLFETFVVGPHNHFAHGAAQAVVQSLGNLYNPLVIYGKSGLGKTHLLHAIGNSVRKRHARATIVYQRTDRLISEFNTARKFDKLHRFQTKYETADVLLLDDIQNFAHTQSQDIFFHIFNTLYEAKRQIVLASDTYPKDIQGLAERLRSRLQWGLVTDIKVPDVQTIQAIIQKKAELQQVPLPTEVIAFLTQHASYNIREIEGAVIRIAAFASMTKQPITLSLARAILNHHPLTHSSSLASLHDIAQRVCERYNIPLSALQSEQRHKDVSLARHICMYLMKKHTNKPLLEIGHFLHRTDHSTVIHAINKIQHTMAENPAFKQEIIELENSFTLDLSPTTQSTPS